MPARVLGTGRGNQDQKGCGKKPIECQSRDREGSDPRFVCFLRLKILPRESQRKGDGRVERDNDTVRRHMLFEAKELDHWSCNFLHR